MEYLKTNQVVDYKNKTPKKQETYSMFENPPADMIQTATPQKKCRHLFNTC